MQMTAAVLRQLPATELAVQQVERPRLLRDDDVILAVGACGICGTDPHIMSGHSYRPELPFVLGHEPVGRVVEAGAAAQEWLGKRAVITLFTGCGHCDACAQGDERLCLNVVSDTGVFGVWGGYADYLLVHAAQLVAVPDTLSDPQAAALVDAGATAANAVRVALNRQPQRALIIGAGPIGLIAAEMLADQGVELQLVQRSKPRRDAATALGHQTLGSIDQADGHFEVVIDCTGFPDSFNPAIEKLSPRGELIQAGYAIVPQADFAELSHKEGVVRGIRSGSRKDLEQVIALTAAKRIRLPEITSWPLESINDALAALNAKQVPGKAVVIPSGKL
jgi:2-desacetyl-2-hydroxyethyl bacteriochlorophyllide A dehydrogenase